MSEELGQIFQNVEEKDLKQLIVEELLNTDNNLHSKTELSKPMRWSCLNILKEFTGNHKLKYSEEILQSFINTSFKYLISKERKGRKEYIEALKSLSKLESEEKETGKNMLNPIPT